MMKLLDDRPIRGAAEKRGSVFAGKKKRVALATRSLRKRNSLFRAFLVVAFCVAAHKLIDATGGVNQLHLARVERVRRVGNFHLIHGIGFAVHFDGLFCRNGGPTQKHVVVGHVLERHQTIILRMNTLFHLSFLFLVCA